MQKGFFFFKILLTLLLFPLALPTLAFSTLESQSEESFNFEKFKLEPRISLWGFTGDFTRGEGQMLMPIYGNQNRAFFGIVEGNVSANDDDWLAGLGLGYRQVIKDYIVGIYTFADCLNSINSNTFWVANPGIEVLGQKWDFNANGYAPFIHKEGVLINEVPASDMGIFKFVSFKGHDRFDHKMQFRIGEEAGRGFDAEIGRVIPHFEQAKLYLGGYHFDSNHGGSINGVEARFLWELNKYAALEVKDYYDNKNHNIFMAGVRLTLGGLSAKEKETFGISSRLMDPIEHDLVINEAGNIPAVMATQRTIDLGKMLVDDNVWFFVPAPGSATTANGLNAVVGNGTFEHPFVDFTPDNFNAINPNIGVIHKNPSLYFAPGNYSFASFVSFADFPGRSGGIAGRFMLPSGWGMFGRSNDFKVPSKNAIFSGGLDIGLNSGSPTILNSIIISKTILDAIPVQGQILDAESSGTIILKNTDLLGNLTISPVASSTYVFLSDSVLNFEAIPGINSINNISATSQETLGAIMSFGISAIDTVINFNGGVNNMTLTSVPNGVGGAAGLGVIIGGISSLNFNGGTSTIKTITNDSPNSAATTVVIGNSSSMNFASSANAVIDAEAIGPGSIVAAILAGDASIINFATAGLNKVLVEANTIGDSSFAVGFVLNNGSAMNFANTNNTNVVIEVGAIGTSTTRTGISADGSSTSQLQRNGVSLTALFPLEGFVTFTDGGGTFGFKATWPAVTPPELNW
jgi:hypothetical protein